jgi:hypothetical protein
MPRRKGNGAGHGGPAKGAGQGDGWGGPAKGVKVPRGTSPKTPGFGDFEPGNTLQMNRTGKAEMRAARTEMLEEKLFNLAMDAEREETQMNAAARLHAIYNGQPVAKTVTANADDIADLSDDAIRAELARIRGDGAEAGEGAKAPGLPH